MVSLASIKFTPKHGPSHKLVELRGDASGFTVTVHTIGLLAKLGPVTGMATKSRVSQVAKYIRFFVPLAANTMRITVPTSTILHNKNVL